MQLGGSYSKSELSSFQPPNLNIQSYKNKGTIVTLATNSSH